MRLIEYLLGRPIRLHSPMALGDLTRALNKSSGSMFWPFSQGVVGSAILGRVSLAYSSSIFEYNAKPVLAGKIVSAPGGSDLRLRYRAPAWGYAFFVFWYVFLGSILFATIASIVTGHESVTRLAFPLVMMFLFAILPAVMTVIGTGSSDSDLHSILNFLSEEVQASEVLA